MATVEDKPAAVAFHLDRVAGIVLDGENVQRYQNELRALRTWFDGLQFLYSQTHLMEIRACKELEAAGTEEKPSITGLVFGNRSCCFQWYAVTLCNFVELIGAIARELDPARKHPRDYLKEVIPAVLDYRHNVGAHTARVRDRKPAQKFVSLLPASTLINGRYKVGEWATLITRHGNTTRGQLQSWSLTETHEKLADRYWPQTNPQ
jgi:hypothetical protein